MSKVTQIQARLLEINPAGFQRLAEAYLRSRGYDRINSFGLVLGADKTARGTPDTLVTLPNGKYLFAEHTSQQTGVYDKFLEDVGKCFDVEKTGIPIDLIDEIVLVHISRMSPKEEYDLATECRRRGVPLSIFGPGTLANDLYLKYPGLARDFLGVAVDTGQIITLDEFVAAYDENVIGTPLDTVLRFRDDEMVAADAALGTGNLLIIAGRPGVGKSRLAVEVCRRFAAHHPAFAVSGIRYIGVDLFEDLRVHFASPDEYLVFVDDANRVSGFEHVVRLLHGGPAGRRVKVVATVRDYALDRVRELTAPYGGGVVLELGPLTDEQITTVVGDEFGINNYLYLERIARIASGNPRLAVMAARLAVAHNSLESIHDVSALYDTYFASIRQDLDDLSSGPLLKAGAAIALFRILDRTNDETVGLALETVGLTKEAFWMAVRRLHELEVVDLYEDEVVRVSDQVLATYLFYLAVFREKCVDFALLLKQLFPTFRRRIIDTLSPVLDAFGGESLVDQLRPAVAEVWGQYEAAGDQHNLLHLAEVFWFVDEIRALCLARDGVRAMLPTTEATQAPQSGPADTSIPSPSLLGVLGALRYGEEGTIRPAIELLVEYACKRPVELPKVAHVLEDGFGFRHNSYASGYAVERAVVEVLWNQARVEADDAATRLFLQVAGRFLRTHHETTKSKSERAIVITNFDLVPTPELFALRSVIWEHLFELYAAPGFHRAIASVLQEFARSGYEVAQPEILVEDARVAVPLLATVIDPTDYADGAAALEVLDHFERHGVAVNPKLRDRIWGPAHALAEAFFSDRDDRHRLGDEESVRLRVDRLRALVAGGSGTSIDVLLAHCVEIGAVLTGGYREFQFNSGVVQLLIAHAEESPNEFAPVIEGHLAAGNALRLQDPVLAAKLIELLGADGAFTLLSMPGYPERERLLFRAFESLPPEAIDEAHLNALYQLYRVAPLNALPHMPDFLLRYEHIDPAVVRVVTSTLLSRDMSDGWVAIALAGLFNQFTEIGGRLGQLFTEDAPLLVRAYLAAHGARGSVDHDAAAFSQILDLDRGFARIYVNWASSQADGFTGYDDHRDYDQLWRRDDYQQVFEGIVHAIHDAERDGLRWSTHLSAFFRIKSAGESEPIIAERQDFLLRRLVEAQHANAEFMEWLFHVVSRLPRERRREHILHLLDRNNDLTLFQRLPLEPNISSWTGSEVPLLRLQIEFLESLLPSLQGLVFLDHKCYLQHRIQRLEEGVERAKRRDFRDDAS